MIGNIVWTEYAKTDAMCSDVQIANSASADILIHQLNVKQA